VKTSQLKASKRPGLPRAPTPSGEEIKGNQASMRLFSEDDPEFGAEFTDSDGKILILVGEYIDEETGERRVLILQSENGERVERAPSEVQPISNHQ
jgi:hypothetical protein